MDRQKRARRNGWRVVALDVLGLIIALNVFALFTTFCRYTSERRKSTLSASNPWTGVPPPYPLRTHRLKP